MPADKFFPEKLELIKYHIHRESIETPETFQFENVIGHDIVTDYDMAFNLDDKLVKTDLILNVETKNKSEEVKKATAHFHGIFIFYIENLEELTETKKNEQIAVHSTLGNALASVTYSTARGILLTRFRDTVFNDFILPIINPEELFKEEK